MINYLKSNIYDFLSTEKRGLFFLWVPVFLGIGIALYFGMTKEPAQYIAFICLFISGVTTYYLRNNYFIFLSTLFITIVFVGFISAQTRTHFMDVRMLPQSYGPAGIQGRIVKIEETAKGQRVILDNLQIARLNANHVPSRIRLHITKYKEGLKRGQWIETWGKIKPVPQPTSPGAFDLQRHLYFEKIGALGFTLGEVKIVQQAPNYNLNIQAYFDTLRLHIFQKIDLALDGKANDDVIALAKTFLTGNKKFLDEETHENIRASGLAHLLAISGLHIGLVSLICFISLRQILVMIPGLALKYPIKKWAAVLAIFGALFYTLLTGASIPTIRAFIMCAFTFGAILIDRKAISLRSVALAATFILLFFPESLLSASFQLSFAAVTALVAFYERPKVFVKEYKIIRYFREIFSSSLIAGLATMPFAAYHFHRIALYGLASNLIAIPVTVFWIMPFGILSLIAMPLNLEYWPLMIMGWGIISLVWVAEQTANLPYALIPSGIIETQTFLLMIIGGLILCLIPHRIRFGSLSLIPVIFVFYLMTPQPILKVSGDGKLLGIKTNEGYPAFSNIRSAQFIRDKWSDQWGMIVQSKTPLSSQYACDPNGCTLTTGLDNTKIAFNRNPIALWEDCKSAEIVISTTSIIHDCNKPKLKLDLQDLAEKGAHALYYRQENYYFVSVKDKRGQRPWTNYGH